MQYSTVYSNNVLYIQICGARMAEYEHFHKAPKLLTDIACYYW